MTAANILFLNHHLDRLHARRPVHGNVALRRNDPDDQDDTYPGDLVFAVPGQPARSDIQYAEWLTIPTEPEQFPQDEVGGRPADDMPSRIFDWLAWAALCAAGGFIGGFAGVHFGWFVLGVM